MVVKCYRRNIWKKNLFAYAKEWKNQVKQHHVYAHVCHFFFLNDSNSNLSTQKEHANI